jgi:multiple sugar transport system substrate-binding protein
VIVDRVVTQVVTEKVKETVIVEGTPQVVEKEVTKVVEKEVTKVVEVEKEVEVVKVVKEKGPVTIRYAGLPSMGARVEEFVQPWLEETGNKLERGVFGQQELTDKIMQAVATGTHLADVVQLPSNARGDVISRGALLEIPDDVQQAVEIDDVMPSIKRTISWEGKVYAFPYDGDIHYYSFRKDLMADSEISGKFRAEYGYDLDPETGAKTWEEWRNIGEFFTGWDWNENGKADDFGLACMTKRGDTCWWGFNSRATAYCKHPDDPGYFFDPYTGDARVNHPGFVRALTEWIEENKTWAPPGGTNFTYGDSANAMNGGRAVQTYNWDAVTQQTNPETSIVKGLQGYNILPGSNEVWNPKTQEWDGFSKPSYAPFHAFGGWVIAVMSSTDRDRLPTVWDMTVYVSKPESGLWFTTRLTGASPYRYSQLEAVDEFANGPLELGEEVAKDYLDAAKRTLEHPNFVTDLAVMGWVQYRDALELGVSKALAGEMEPQEALDGVAVAFDEISERMGGKERQAEIYRKTMGL